MESNTKITVIKTDLVIPPLRNTNSLEIPPEQTEICEIARKQLENLNKFGSKKKPTPSSSDTEAAVTKHEPTSSTEVRLVTKQSNLLSSPIVTKAELEEEIRKKVSNPDQSSKIVGSIEIPHELILSGLNATPVGKSTEEAVQLHDQELIDILEGKSNETETYEVLHTDNGVSYELVSEAKAKLLEREIAMRQIASLPIRKNKKSLQSTSGAQQSIAQSLAAEWADDDKEEMVLEVVNMEEPDGEPKIKILNMTILNEATELKPKPSRLTGEGPTQFSLIEPKILNKDAPKSPPKILNINASAVETPATFKRSRVVKKKEIWDPSEAKPGLAEKKLPMNLPSSITIKKVTKELITKAKAEPCVQAEIVQKLPVKKGKKLSEIDKLLQDEGAVNMIYSLERENNNQDVPEIELKANQKSLISKAKAIKNVVMKQSTSPQDTKPLGRVRAKRDVTPVKTTLETKVLPTKTPVSRKKKADNTWDYIYSQTQATCDDAMIIRRRSNSSYSSSAASPRRMSVDVNEILESPPASAKKLKVETDVFEFTKPPQKNTKSPADDLLNKDFVEQLRGKISNVITKNKEKPSVPAATTTKGRKRAAAPVVETAASPAKRSSERRANGSDHKEYRLERIGKVAHIIISPNPLSTTLLSEMKSLLNQLETDDCHVVLITSSEGFSEGLDYSALIQTTIDKRKQAASDLVTALK